MSARPSWQKMRSGPQLQSTADAAAVAAIVAVVASGASVASVAGVLMSTVTTTVITMLSTIKHAYGYYPISMNIVVRRDRHMDRSPERYAGRGIKAPARICPRPLRAQHQLAVPLSAKQSRPAQSNAKP